MFVDILKSVGLGLLIFLVLGGFAVVTFLIAFYFTWLFLILVTLILAFLIGETTRNFGK